MSLHICTFAHRKWAVARLAHTTSHGLNAAEKRLCAGCPGDSTLGSGPYKRRQHPLGLVVLSGQDQRRAEAGHEERGQEGHHVDGEAGAGEGRAKRLQTHALSVNPGGDP